MNDAFAAALTQAHALVEAGRGAEAETLLRPLLADHADNPDLWWVYAYAVEDPAEAKAALYNVLRLDAEYPGAQALLQQLEAQQFATEPMVEPATSGIRPLAPRPTPPTALPAMPVPGGEATTTRVTAVPDFEDDTAPTRQRGGAGWLLPLVATVAAVVILGGIIWAFTRPGDPALSPTAPAVALEVTTLPPTVVDAFTVAPTATFSEMTTVTDDILTDDETAPQEGVGAMPGAQMSPAAVTAVPLVVVTQEAAAQELVTAEEQLSRQLATTLTLAEPTTGAGATTLGDTLVVRVCATRATLRTDTEQSFTQLAAASAALDLSAYQALGVQLVDCAADQPLRTLAASVSLVQQGVLPDVLAGVQPVALP